MAGIEQSCEEFEFEKIASVLEELEYLWNQTKVD